MIAMLLAAGRGERLRPLTDRLPKALVEVDGVSLLERHLANLGAAGVEVAVINLGWLGERIVERVGSGRRYGLQVVYSPEYDRVLETGGGIYRALPLLGPEPFWVVNSDVLCDWHPSPEPLAGDCLGELLLVPNPAYRSAGDFDLQDGRVRTGGATPLTFTGIARYRPEFFATARGGRFPLSPLLYAAAADGLLAGRLHDGLWADVGTPERLAQATALLRSAPQTAHGLAACGSPGGAADQAGASSAGTEAAGNDVE